MMNKVLPPEVATVIATYPKAVRKEVLILRQLIMTVAKALPSANTLEETLKWGEPSYLIKGGSTIRIAYKKSKPQQYAMYFNCRTVLLETFRELYRNELTFEGNRAIVFNNGDELPIEVLRHCIDRALNYHRLKNLPLLGC